MPNGTVAPGKVCPSGPVPIIGSTILMGSGTCATDIEAAISAAKQIDFMTKQYRKMFGCLYATWLRNENLSLSGNLPAWEEQRVPSDPGLSLDRVLQYQNFHAKQRPGIEELKCLFWLLKQ